jgi:hypothetical protein
MKKDNDMATADAGFEHERPSGNARTPDTVERDRGTLQRWHQRNTEHKRARLVSPRNRRRLARQLRQTARDANERRIRPGPEVLLHDRASAVRFELLEVADLLERADDPDPNFVTDIHLLLANGESPLYHPEIHVSELHAALYYIRAGLVRKHTDHQSTERARPGVARDESSNRWVRPDGS